MESGEHMRSEHGDGSPMGVVVSGAFIDRLGPELPAAITFAGQGADALGPLAALIDALPELRALIRPACEALRALARTRPFRWSGRVEAGCDPLGWIDDPASRPPQAYLTSTIISQPLILLAQAARYEAARRRGLGALLERGGVVALTGHSQGVMPAILVSEGRGIIRPERLADFARYMLWQGLHMAESAPDAVPESAGESAGESADASAEGPRGPMAAIAGFSLDQLVGFCDALGADSAPADRPHITLHNGRTRFVVSGRPAVLNGLRGLIEARMARLGAAQKPRFTWEWLMVGGPFHSPLMRAGQAAMRETVRREGLRFDARRLKWPVLDPADGRRLDTVDDLTEALIATQFMRPVRWSAVVDALVDDHGATAILDCGPGDGVARLTRGILRGAGVPALALDTPADQRSLFTVGAIVDRGVQWQAFRPTVARLPDGRAVVDNRYTRLTGHSPIILPGMTPTTVDVPIVAAAANAGFTAELAGGGQVTAAVLERRLDELAAALEPGVCATFNALYLDRYLWDLHLGGQGRVFEAARRGAPLCGVTISAGIPPLDEAVALLDRLESVGLWLNAFKPGTAAQVDQVLKIAAARPARPLFVHLEGGKAGGHHSWTDLDPLLLATWHRIRAVPNAVLCVGGGVGDEARCAALLTGEWAKAYGQRPMPVDAVFLGTVTMACAEATASPAVKAALVGAAGTPEWVATGEVAGAITSGRSGLDADIHYLENAAARCGRLLDAVAGDADAVAARRGEIIAALNATARPYFGDIQSMTWLEALARLVELTAIGRGGPYEDGAFPDRSWRQRVADFARMAEARLAGVRGAPAASVVDDAALDDPRAFVTAFAESWPEAAEVTVHPADARAFVGRICARPGKPVNFVPVIDADVRRWYKADSLWAAQDDRFDAEQVLVIPGPAAVAGIRAADEPVAAVLARFEAATVDALVADGAEPAPRPRRFGETPPQPAPAVSTAVAHRGDADDRRRFAAVARIAGPRLHAALAPRIARGRRLIDNPLAAACAAIPGASLTFEQREDAPDRLIWSDPASGDGVEIRDLVDTFEAVITGADIDARAPAVRLRFKHGSMHGRPTPVLDPVADRRAVRDCYTEALFDRPLAPQPLFAEARATVELDPARIAAYARLTDHPAADVPACFAFSAIWRALFETLAADDIAAGLLRLVHLDQTIEPGAGWPLLAGEALSTRARIVELEQTRSGLVVRVEAHIERGAVCCATLLGGFFIRGGRAPDGLRRVRSGQRRVAVDLVDAAAVGFAVESGVVDFDVPPAIGDRLTLDVQQVEHRAEKRTFSAQGVVRRGDTPIGRVCISEAGAPAPDRAHPLDAWIDALGGPVDRAMTATAPRTLARVEVSAPRELTTFAEVGLDHNPIHRSPAFARLAGFDGPIVHGMWTTARLHGFVVRAVAGGDASRIGDWRVQFLAPVAPGATLELKATRVGLRDGARIVEATAAVDGVIAARARTTIRAPRTAYVFPGQGIQRAGMGMADYAASPAARAVWDRADAVTRAKLGFSILRVVRENPRALIVDGERLTHPEGVLHLTRFTQPAMAVLAMAQMARLREAGAAVPDAMTAGHSVGEYNALSAVVEVLPLESVVEIVYQRGCVMHRFVPRDAQGRSAYRMGVIRPHHAGIDHAAAEALVEKVGAETGAFVQIVNYNVRGRQYAVTGEHAALDRLAAELMALRRPGGKAPYVEVPGVDVPFHSAVLRAGVDAFRQTLQTCLPETFAPERLVGRYVPNLVARAFSLERPFVEAIAAACDSPVIADVLADFEARAAQPAALARTLLVELLAYQFASPVRWIETQDLLLAPGGVERVIEVGVGYQPTVSNMFRQTAAGLGRRGVEVLNIEADGEAVFARDVDPEPAAAPVETQNVPETVEPPVANAPHAAPAAPSGPIAHEPIADVPVSVADALGTLLALQGRIRPEQLDDGETLDGLFEGVSSRRNQALLDLSAEFEPGTLDAAHDMPLAKLADTLAERAKRYTHPGAYLRAAHDEALRGALGRVGWGRAEVARDLESRYGLGQGLIGAALDVLTIETRGGASARGGELGALAGAEAATPAEARALLDRVIERLSARIGRVIAPKAAAQASGGAVDAAAVTALEDRITGPDGVLAGLARDLLARLGGDGLAAQPAPADTDDVRAAIEAEHGAEYLDRIAPRFDARKHIALTHAAPFARRDVARLYFAAANGRPVDAAAPGRLALFAEDPGATLADTARWYAAQTDDAELRATLEAIAAGEGAAPAVVRPTRPSLTIDGDGAHYAEVADPDAADLEAFVAGLGDAVDSPHRALLESVWRAGARGPLPFAGRTAVVSGASPGSIAVEVVRHLLRGGARVVVTTTTMTKARRRFYRRLFHTEAGPRAELHVVPCNMASLSDIEALVDWLFSEQTEQAGATVRVLKPAFSPDLLLPFGAVGDAATLDRLDGRAQVALRVLLLGVEALIGAVARRHIERGVPDDRCHVVLPLSPNHGAFGGDGLYAETKAALEVLVEKWRSEHDAWGRATTLCAARIGWVRGTGLMDANNPVAARLEAQTAVRTFSAAEMGFLIAGLCAGPARAVAQDQPLRADLTGRFGAIPDLRETVGAIRADIGAAVQTARRRAELDRAFAAATGGSTPARPMVEPAVAWPLPVAEPTPCAWPQHGLDPKDMVVIVGLGEVGPCGSDRTRFELEVGRGLSPASVLELAWMCGLVRWEDGPGGGGWIDVEADAPIAEADIAGRFGDAVLQRSGIRLIEPETAGYDPEAVPVHATVYIDRDFEFPVADEAEARAFAAADPERTAIRREGQGADARWLVTRKAGAEVKVLRHARLQARIAGLIPQGFDFARYGIPVEMTERVDRVALFNLVATVDAFLSAGLDPETLLAHIHPARVANTQGAGIGGMASLRRLYQDHLLGAARQGDVLQETLINVAAAYVVQGYIGSYGAMSHPVGACATAAVSLEEALDKIRTGKADVVVAGGFDDIGPEGAVGFADMGATAETDAMFAMGLEADEISRANDARRRGFVEAHGGGTALVTRGDVALELGLPIRGVLAWAGSFGDGVQQSIPAPGLGALAAAMGGAESPLGRALAAYGIGADDIALVYKHDTSTAANDVNENALHHRIQDALGRTRGNPLFAVSQKTLTGHSKGGAAAWQLGGLCQALSAGIVPGNRNLDEVDPAMAAYDHVAFSDESLEPGPAAPLRAGLLTSLGFGHVSAVALVLHPAAFAAALDAETEADWRARVAERQAWSTRRRAAILMGEEAHYTKRTGRRFVAADGTACQTAEEARVLLDPHARLDPARGVFVSGGAR